jgi:hypothetical protein
MTISAILLAAAVRIEQGDWDALDPALSVRGSIQHVAPDTAEALTAIRFFAQFMRTDGISWERELGRTKGEVVRALRDAAAVAS